jgi:hypothetical protein
MISYHIITGIIIPIGLYTVSNIPYYWLEPLEYNWDINDGNWNDIISYNNITGIIPFQYHTTTMKHPR